MAAHDEDDDLPPTYKFEPDDGDPFDGDDASSVDLIRCPRCRKYCYEEAVRCPHCGDYIVARGDRKPRWYLITVIVCLLIVVVAWILNYAVGGY